MATKVARGGLMVHNFDSYAYACGFESGLGHGAYGTLGKSPHPVVLCPVSPMSEDCVCLVLMSRPKVGGIMYAPSAQPQPVKWPQLINCSLSCLFLLSYNTS